MEDIKSRSRGIGPGMVGGRIEILRGRYRGQYGNGGGFEEMHDRVLDSENVTCITQRTGNFSRKTSVKNLPANHYYLSHLSLILFLLSVHLCLCIYTIFPPKLLFG